MSLDNLDGQITPGDLLDLGLVTRDSNGRLQNGGSNPLPAVTNPAGLRRWRAAMGKALQSYAVINCLGDSIVLGVGSDGSKNYVAANDTTYRTSGWVAQLRALFATTYGDPGEGGIFALDPAGRVTATGTADLTHYGYGPYESGAHTKGTTSTLVWALPACTEIDIWTSNESASSNSAASWSLAYTGTITNGSPTVTGIPDTGGIAVGMTVTGTGIPASTTILSVDSATQVTLSANATAGATETLQIGTTFKPGLATTSDYTFRKATTITGLKLATQPLTIKSTSSSNDVYVACVSARKQATGVRVHRFAVSGTTTANLVGQDLNLNSDLVGQTRMMSAGALAPQADLVIISLGANDYVLQNTTDPSLAKPGTTAPQYQANLQAMVNIAVAAGACVLLVSPPRQYPGNAPSPQTYSEDDYAAAMKAVALSTDHCAFINMHDVWQSWDSANGLGLMTATSVHPNLMGHGDMARIIYRVLTNVYEATS